MTLKADRQIDSEELRFYLDETSDNGVIVCVSTAGSGISMDQAENVATVVGATSGAKPLGVLMNEFVDIDQTRFVVNWHKDQQNKGDKATITTKGWVVTNKVVNATAGSEAVLASSGFVTNKVNGTHNEVATPTVGRFRTGKDEAGFATLYVDL
jgi:hypothetical protein